MITLHGHTKHCHRGRNHTFKSTCAPSLTIPNLVMLGAPIIGNIHFSAFFEEVVGPLEAQELLQLLITLHDPQVATTLFLMCGAYSTPSDHLVIIPLTRFDNDVHSCLEECGAIQLMNDAWSQAC